MLIDCNTCTARGKGCADCVVTVLLGAPPAEESGPVVVPLRPTRLSTEAAAEDAVVPAPGVVVEFDDVERRAVPALVEGGLVPPLRHQDGERPTERGARLRTSFFMARRASSRVLTTKSQAPVRMTSRRWAWSLST